MRRALGLRRSWRQKVAPFVLLGVVTIPAIINVGIGYVTRDRAFDRFEIITYRDYVGVSSALLLFVAIVAPDVMCPDRRQHVLPLMFARPMTGVDYVVAKVGAIVAILFAFSFIPQLVLFVGNMLVSDSALDYLTGHLDIAWQVPVAVLLLAVYYAVIGVAIASLSERRIVAGAAIIGVFLVTSIASGILVGDDFGVEGGSPAALLNVLALPLYLRDLVFLGHIDPDSPLGGVANGGVMAVALYAADRRRRPRRAAAPLPLGGTLTPAPTPTPLPAPPPSPRRPIRTECVRRRKPPSSTLCANSASSRRVRGAMPDRRGSDDGRRTQPPSARRAPCPIPPSLRIRPSRSPRCRCGSDRRSPCRS